MWTAENPHRLGGTIHVNMYSTSNTTLMIWYLNKLSTDIYYLIVRVASEKAYFSAIFLYILTKKAMTMGNHGETIIIFTPQKIVLDTLNKIPLTATLYV